MFMVLGAVLYLPFVHYGYVFKFMDKLTSFLQVMQQIIKCNFLIFSYMSLSFFQLILKIAPPCSISEEEYSGL
jgi:hypothetical protein